MNSLWVNQAWLQEYETRLVTPTVLKMQGVYGSIIVLLDGLIMPMEMLDAATVSCILQNRSALIAVLPSKLLESVRPRMECTPRQKIRQAGKKSTKRTENHTTCSSVAHGERGYLVLTLLALLHQCRAMRISYVPTKYLVGCITPVHRYGLLTLKLL